MGGHRQFRQVLDCGSLLPLLTMRYRKRWPKALPRLYTGIFLGLFLTVQFVRATIPETESIPNHSTGIFWSQAGNSAMTNTVIRPPLSTNMDRGIWEPYLQQEAAKGNAWAKGFLGYLILEYPNQPTETLLGIELLKSSANRGCYLAMQELGARFTQGRGVRIDYQEAVKWLQPAAEHGLPVAQAELGYCYSLGYGVSSNQTEALKWFRSAAGQTNRYSIMNIGSMYLFGLGVNRDKNQARRWLIQAAQLGSPRAMYYLVWMTRNDPSRSNSVEDEFNWSKKSAELGDGYGAYELALCYYEGRGTIKSQTNYIYWLTKAAEKGVPDAQYFLALAYFKGEGVREDHSLALTWCQLAVSNQYNLSYSGLATMLGYPNLTNEVSNSAESHRYMRKGAEVGDLVAQFNVAMANFRGDEGTTNLEEGKRWLISSAESGYSAAEEWLAQCYLQGKMGFSSNFAEGIRWLRRAAEHDSAKAQGNLGLRLVTGNGVERNVEEALKWLRRSAEHGDAYGQNCLGYALERETATPDLVEIDMWYILSAKQNFQKGYENTVRIASWLTEQQLIEAQRRAKEFHPVPEQVPPRSKAAPENAN